MHKKIIRRVALLNCLLLALPGLGLAAESTPESKDSAVEEIVVNAIPLEKYLVTTSVITDKDIKAKGAQNLAQALEDVTGLNFHRGKKNANAVDIRGSSMTYTKIYIDGVLVNPFAKVNNSSIVDLNTFPVDNIAKIEVVKGPAPVQYGTDAIGGIILITTKNGKDYQGSGISLVGGSNSTYNGSVYTGGGDDKFNYFINAGSVHNDGYGSEPNATMQSKFFNTKLNWKLKDNSSLTLVGNYSITDSGASLQQYDPFGKPVSSTSGFWPGLNNWRYKDWEKTQLSLDYVKKLNSKLNIDFKAYHYAESQGLWANGADHDSSVVFNAQNIASSINGAAINKGSSYSGVGWNMSLWDSFLNGVELQSDWKLNTVHTLTFGTLYNNLGWKKSVSPSSAANQSDPNNWSWQATNNERRAYYLQDNITPNEKTIFTLGIRRDENKVTNYDQTSRTVSANDPIVNAVYKIDDRNTLRTSYGETISFPLLSQLFGNNPNPNLKPERAKNYEIGFKHQFDDTLTGDIAIFKNDITDYIYTDKNKYSYNLNWAKIKGVELELKKRFSERWNGFFNYAYLDTAARYQTDSMVYVAEQAYTPKNHINYGVDYQAGNGYKFSLTGHWVLSDRFTNDLGTGDTRTKVNGVAPVYSYLPGYHTLDFQVRRQVNDKQDWYVTIYNIFDKQYDDELFYPAEGRTVLVGTNFKF